MSRQDGIVVYDGYNTTPNGKIDDISETLSEYFGGTVGTGGAAGTKPFTNGFTALKSLDTGNGTPGSVGYNDNQFTSADAAWSNVKVWVDANHDGKSWIDTDNDGIKDAGEATELKSLAELGITKINLTTTSQSGLMNNGNEVLASGTFQQYVDASGNPAPTGTLVTRAAVAANLLNNPDGHIFTTSGTGKIVTTQGSGGASGVTADQVLNSAGEAVDVTAKNVANAYGGSGNDTLTGNSGNNWLVGGPGADTFNAGAGDDVLVIDAADLQENIHAGAGLDLIQVVGDASVVLNLAEAEAEIVQGDVSNNIYAGNLIRFRKRLQEKNTGRRFSQPEKLRRAA